jgi:hypothetical protein
VNRRFGRPSPSSSNARQHVIGRQGRRAPGRRVVREEQVRLVNDEEHALGRKRAREGLDDYRVLRRP